MSKMRDYIRGGLGVTMGSDAARGRRIGQVTRNQLAYGVVGHEESTPAYVELRNGQPWVEVTMEPEGDEIMARVGFPSAGNQSGWYLPLSFGCRVVLELIDGDPQGAVIVGRLHDETCALPATAAGVSTGAAGVTGDVTAAAPAWQFQVLADGQLLAIETLGGDILIHSAGAVEIKCSDSQRIHLNGAVSLGEGPATAPTGAVVGAGGADVQGTPADSAVPVPYVPVPNTTPANIAYSGNSDGVVRAKEQYQFTAVSDPVDYPFFAAVYAHPLIGLPPPQALVSSIRGGGTGSKHTASD